MKLAKGTILQNYRIIEAIGEGGMGEVYLAEEILLGRQVAVKRLNPLLTEDPQFSERFINEARIQARLLHPHIVALHNFFMENEVYYMVMEYAPGITLKDLIATTGPIPEQRTLQIFEQLISALAYAHAKGIIHRDIKPSNIMIDGNDNVKVMDFGIARLMSDKHLTRTGAKLGTLFYMSPEQVLAVKDIDHRTDIYSAGVVLYEMLTGRLPFNADTDSDFVVMKEITESTIPDPREVYPYISDDTVAILSKAVHKQREYRYQDCSDIINDCDGQLVDAPKMAAPSDDPGQEHSQKYAEEETEKPREKRSYPIWLAVAIVFVIVISIVVLPKVFKRAKSYDIKTEMAPIGMVIVPGGTFTMGRTTGSGNSDELPTHSVTLNSFYMGKYEVTQSEWIDTMGSWDSDPYGWGEKGVGDNYPAYNVSWYAILKYCNLRSMAEGLTPVYSISGSTDPATWGSNNSTWDAAICNWSANGYRLPTEAEWEYAARGATNTPDYLYSGSDDINDVAWYDGNNSPNGTKPVGTKAPNGLGLHDMSGNVDEWCWDWYSSYSSNPQNNPSGPASGSIRVTRGGSWYGSADYCRVAGRDRNYPYYSFGNLGFRLCRAVL